MALAAMAMAAVSIVLGFFFFIAFLVVALIVGIVLWFRLRPVRQQMRRSAERAAEDRGPVIEGDFTVVEESKDRHSGGA
jgi:membrane protein implicated in regulation of membrane protease activity